jgi:hypothetical protein
MTLNVGKASGGTMILNVACQLILNAHKIHVGTANLVNVNKVITH